MDDIKLDETADAQPVTNIEKATDIDRLADLEDYREEQRSTTGPTERAPERDEHGRL